MTIEELLKNENYNARVSLGNSIWFFWSGTTERWVVCENRRYAHRPIVNDFATEEEAVNFACERYNK